MALRIYSAGDLSERVQFQRRAAGKNGLNEPIGGWVDDGAKVWARVAPVRAEELLRAGATTPRSQAIAVVRYSHARTAQQIVEQGLRLVWKGRPYDISGALAVDGGQQWIELNLVAGVRDGRPA